VGSKLNLKRTQCETDDPRPEREAIDEAVVAAEVASVRMTDLPY